jgi:hypothetical protein
MRHPNSAGPDPQVITMPAAATAWSICPLCGQPIWPSYDYHEMHSWCEQFLSFLPQKTKVKITFPKEASQ